MAESVLPQLLAFGNVVSLRFATMTETGGVTVKDVTSHDFVIAYAAHLKRIGKIEVPKWADLVKTASFKELAPYDQDWYYIRAGALTGQTGRPEPELVCAAPEPGAATASSASPRSTACGRPADAGG